MMIKKKQFALLIYLLLIVAFCILFIPSKHILAEEEQASSRAYCYLCKYKKSDGLMYIKERQFYQKVEALKEAYGESVDKVALTAAVMHRYGTDGAYNKVYESNFDETSYKARAKGLSKLMQASSADSASLTEEESIAVRENEKIDLLTIAALVMVDSNHHGTYSDVCFKQGLAGNRLVGNDNDSIFGTVLNAITCKQQEIKLPDGSSYEGDSDRVIAASNKIRLQNLKKVCNNGFVGGLYEGISQMSDGSQKETKKKLYAQQIIDLANYYKKLYGKKEEANCNINIAGATGDFASWKQYDSKWGNVIMGDTPNVSKYGCMVTSIAMQIARSGTRIGELPSGYNEFNPGAFVTSLSSHGGFVEKSANFSGTGYQTIAPNWKMLDMVEGNYSDDSNFANLISKELSEAYDGQYQKFIILRIKATGHDQHWVAVNGVENGHVTVFDPGSAGKTPILSENYNNLVITGYKVMYATDVKFGQTGNTTNNTCETSYGTGDIKIPAQYGGGGYTVTEIDQWNWLYDCGKVYREWLSKGAKTDNGIATIDGRYLIACTSTFGKVGDKIDFFLDDGTRIPAIMFDTKNPNDAGYNQWGHDGGANVLEFEVLSSYYHRYGNPGSTTWFPQWHGKRVSSATNISRGGTSSASTTTSSSTTTSTLLKTAGDGERMARLAAIISGSVGGTRKQALRHNSGDNSSISLNNAGYYADEYYSELYEYYAIHDMAAGSNASRPAKYAQCDVAVGTIIAAAYDPSTPVTGDSWWTSTNKYTGKGYDNLGVIKGSKIPEFCQPGDILTATDHQHVMLYVGNNIVREYYPSAASDICIFEGGGTDALYPGLTSYTRAGHDKNTWRVFRPTGDIKNHISKKISVNFEVYGISNPDYYSEEEHQKAVERVLSSEGRYVKGKNKDVAGTLGEKYTYTKDGKTYNAYWSRADELLRKNKDKITQFGSYENTQQGTIGERCVNGQAVSGNNGVGGTNMNYSNAVEIPDSLWKSHDSTADPSIVVVEENGNVLASRKADVRREGGSTNKVFAGYAAVKLLDVNSDVITGTRYVYNISSSKNDFFGKSEGATMSVINAAADTFPGSQNRVADSIPLAIGRKYYNGSDNNEAYSVGIAKMNELYKQVGCTNTNICDGSGINGIFGCVRNNFDGKGITRNPNGNGFSANDLAVVTIQAMQDENFLKSYITYGNSQADPVKAQDRNVEGLFYVKSGTQMCGHGVWAFNKNGKRYYIVILGIKCKASNNARDSAKKAITNDVYNWAINNLIS